MTLIRYTRNGWIKLYQRYKIIRRLLRLKESESWEERNIRKLSNDELNWKYNEKEKKKNCLHTLHARLLNNRTKKITISADWNLFVEGNWKNWTRGALAATYYYPNRSRDEIIFSLAQPPRRITILGSRSTISYRL